MNVGILSGTFDPVHKGHIWLAKEVLARFDVDRVVFLPELKPRNKIPRTSYEHRRTLLEIATKDEDRIDILDIPTDSHSVKNTLKFIEQQYEDINAIKLIMGADVLEGTGKWDDFELLKEQAEFIICLRSEDDVKSALATAEGLGINVEMIDSEHALVSSSKIRDKLAEEKTPESISRDVHAYIRENRLYEGK